MTPQEAKEILTVYRPGTADANDPEFAEALQLCDRDPELKRWFDDHCAVYLALRARFRQTVTPEGLKEQIIAERKVQRVNFQLRPALLAAAAIVVLVGLGIYWMPEREDTGYAAYRERMVSTALRNYGMALATNDPAQIRTFLNRSGAPSDYTVPSALKKIALAGCAIEPWQGANVSMICFDSGQPHPPGQANDVWFFIIDQSAVRDAPAGTSPSVVRVNRAMTASWSAAGRNYLLVVDGDEQLLRKYLVSLKISWPQIAQINAGSFRRL
jgi:hypothetical protein